MFILAARLEPRLDDEQSSATTPVFIEPPPMTLQDQPSHNSQHRSIETLVVVLAVITILAVVAGVVARLCGGRHFGGSGENDIEGWVERKCRSCIDAGVPTTAPPPPPPPPPPPAVAEDHTKPAAEEVKK